MLWTAEAVEDLKKLALAGKERKPHLRGARRRIPKRGHWQGEPDRDQTQRRRARLGAREGPRPRGVGPNGRRLVTLGPTPPTKAPAPPPLAIPRSSRGTGGGVERFAEAEIGEMRRLRFEDIRESACRWPLGDPRSGDFAYCGLTPVGGQSYCAGHCRMAYRSPQRASDCAGASRAPRHRGVHGGCREAQRASRLMRRPGRVQSSRTRRSGPARPRPLRAGSTRTE